MAHGHRDRSLALARPLCLRRGRCLWSISRLSTHLGYARSFSAAGLLARSTVQIYEIIQQNHGIEVRALRKLAGMQGKADKHAFDQGLIDLQNTADIVISGVAENRTHQGTKSGWNGTCYMLAEQWMHVHDIAPLQLSPAEAKTQLFARLKPRWEEEAVRYLQKKLASFS